MKLANLFRRHPAPPAAPDGDQVAEVDEILDPDPYLVNDYLTGDLSAEQRDAFERRLDTDPGFAALALPRIAAWNAGPVPRPLPEYRVRRAYARFRAGAGLPTVPPEATPVPIQGVAAPTSTPAAMPVAAPEPRVFVLSRGKAFALAAAWIASVGVGVYYREIITHQPVPVDPGAVMNLKRGVVADEEPIPVPLGDSTVTTVHAHSSIYYDPHPATRRALEVSLHGGLDVVMRPRPGRTLLVRIKAQGAEVRVTAGRLRIDEEKRNTLLVQVTAGAAEVRSNTGPPLVLRAGERARVKKGEPAVKY